MRSELRITGAGIEAVVTLEVPTPVVLRSYQQRYAEVEQTPEDLDRDFFQFQCERLGQGLSLALDGAPVEGAWVPVDHPSNGLGGELFFVYLMRFEPAQPPQLGAAATLTLRNESLPKARMYLSGYAEAGLPWAVASNSARDLIGQRADEKDVGDDPDAWTRDEQARVLEVSFTRGE